MGLTRGSESGGSRPLAPQAAATCCGAMFSAGGRPARVPGLPGLIGTNVLERHVGGGRDPIGAEVGLEGRGHEDGAILGTEEASGHCPAPALSPRSRLGWDLRPHLLLVALQEGDEEARDSAGRGVHLGQRWAQAQAPPPVPWEAARPGGRGAAGVAALTVCANRSSPASVWNMMWRRRLWKSVQLEALVTWGREA